MQRCWRAEATERPNFQTVVEDIKVLLSASTVEYYALLDEPYECLNSECSHLYSSIPEGISVEENGDTEDVFQTDVACTVAYLYDAM